jgi:hypothetical protein
MSKAIWIGIVEVVIACAAVSSRRSDSTTGAFAQSAHSPATPTQRQHAPTQSELLRIVRASTERFQDISVAEDEGYALQFGCVTGPDAGAMELHFIKSASCRRRRSPQPVKSIPRVLRSGVPARPY